MTNIYRRILLLTVILYLIPLYGRTQDSLQYYIEHAWQHSPQVKAAYLEYQASLQRLPQAGAWSDPEVEFSFYTSPMHIVGGKNIANVKLMQMFPWFGTQKAAKKEAHYMAQMALEKVTEAKIMLKREIQTLWYTLVLLQSKLKTLEASKATLSRTESVAIQQLASAGISMPSISTSSMSKDVSMESSSSLGMPMSQMAGMGSKTSSTTEKNTSNMPVSQDMSMSSASSMSGSLSSILQIQLQIAELENQILDIESQINSEKVKFNTLINRKIHSSITLPDSLEMVDFSLTQSDALSLLSSHNSMLRMAKQQEGAYKEQGKMLKKMSMPMWGIGVQYMINKRENSGMMMSGMDGKNMIMPMVSVTIPIYRSKYNAQQKEAKLKRKATHQQYTQILQDAEAQIYSYYSQLEEVSRRIKLYENKLSISEKIYQLSLQQLSSGRVNLESLLQIHQQMLSYQQAKIEQIAQYNTLVSNIESFVLRP